MKFNLKLLYSPAKWLSCLLFVVMIPIIMYAPTYYDFTNISTIYIPFLGIILFTDIVSIDKSNNFSEIVYLSDRKPIKTFLQRYFIVTVLLLGFILLLNGIFRISQQINNNFMPEPISLLEFLLIVCGSSIMLGTLSMSVANFLNNPFIGYGVALFYWLYWNINWKKQSLFNLFPFVNNPTFYEKLLIVEYLLVFLLILLNCIIAKISPFLIADKLKYLFSLKTQDKI
jgi:hypothetical protein